jgi:small-conductance mechanosensitive channel
MKLKSMPNVLGIIGVFCSLIFWLLLAFRKTVDHIPFGSTLPWFSWFVLWGVGLVLVLMAGALGLSAGS